MVETLPPANDNATATAPSQRIVRIAVRLFLVGVFLLMIGVPAAMLYTYFIDAWAVRVMICMGCAGVACLLMSCILITITKKYR